MEKSLTKTCKKLLPKKNPSPQSALLYLKLRSKSVSKKQSLRFAVKQRCRSDVTQKYQGPANNKILKLKSQRKKDFFTNKGWKMGNLELDLGPKYQLDSPRNDHNEEEIRKLNRIMHRTNNKKLRKYLEYMEVIRGFFSSQGQRRLQGLNNKDRMKEIRKIREDLNTGNISQSYESFAYSPSDSVRLSPIAPRRKRKLSLMGPVIKRKSTKEKTNMKLRNSDFLRNVEEDEETQELNYHTEKRKTKFFDLIRKKVEKARNRKRYLSWQNKLYSNVAKHSKYLSDVSP